MTFPPLQSKRPPHKDHGFTLIELIMVMVITGILAVVAIPAMLGTQDMRLNMAAMKVQSDIRYAQSLAMSTQRWTGMLIVPNTDLYYVAIGNSGPTPSGWGWAKNPLTKEDFIGQLNAGEFKGIDLLAYTMGGTQSPLIFNKWGEPFVFTSGYPPLTNPSGIRLSNGTRSVDVFVERGTGRVRIQ